MTTNQIDRSALAANLRHQIATGMHGGVAYFTGGPMPDESLAELFPEVADALDAFDAVNAEAAKLTDEHREAITKRAAHKNSPEAVYTTDGERGLVFTDPTGVGLQNAVREVEKKLSAVGARSKSALHRYLVEAFSRVPEARDTFRDRAAQADAEAKDLAAKLTRALADRERYWRLAGKPVPGVSAAALPAVQSQRASEHDQHARTLSELLSRALTFPAL